MSRTDFSEYEQRRAEFHESNWRLVASLFNIRSRECRFRQCRRLQCCVGPMLPSEHQRFQVRAQREIGLSGNACAKLPLCTAQMTERQYAPLRAAVDELVRQLDGAQSDYELLSVVRRRMCGQHRHPSSAP